MPDECEDCNDNGIPDALDILGGASLDCQDDGIPDECQLESSDCNGDLIPDDCQLDGNDCNALNSFCKKLRSELETAPEDADWTESSLMRMRMFAISFSAPSAVWMTEMPSLAFRSACWRPRI